MHARKLILAALAATALSSAIAGCGGSGSGSDKSIAGVRSTLHAFVEDIKNGDGGDACDLLTTAQRTRAGRGNAVACGASVDLARGLLGAKAIASIEARIDRLPITVNGDRATAAAVTAGSGSTTLVYSGGKWLIGRTA